MQEPVNIIYDADGNIDYDATLLDGMTEHNKMAVLSKTNTTGVLDNKKCLEYHNNLRDSKIKIQHQQKKIEKVLKSVDDLAEKQDIIPDDDRENEPVLIKKPIQETISKVLDEIREYPELKSDVINSVADINANYDKYTTTQRINIYDIMGRWGRNEVKLYGITKTGGKIHGHKVINFGSIDDYDIDTLPIHAIRGKGQEITYLSQLRKSDGRKTLISRRFVSNVLSYWATITGIRYTTHGNSGDICAIDMWGRDVDGFSHKVITGNDVVAILKDILSIIRSGTHHKSTLSPHMQDIISYIMENSTLSAEELISDMKKRIYWDFQIGRFCWAYPKMQTEYIIGLIDLLKSGNYILDLGIPLIYDLYRYPIRCTDINVRPMTDERHEKNSDSYDISQYIWERD